MAREIYAGVGGFLSFYIATTGAIFHFTVGGTIQMPCVDNLKRIICVVDLLQIPVYRLGMAV